MVYWNIITNMVFLDPGDACQIKEFVSDIKLGIVGKDTFSHLHISQ